MGCCPPPSVRAACSYICFGGCLLLLLSSRVVPTAAPFVNSLGIASLSPLSERLHGRRQQQRHRRQHCARSEAAATTTAATNTNTIAWNKSNSDDSSFPCPPGLEYLDFQKEAIAAMLLSKTGLLLCDEMGLGKTISAIGALNSILLAAALQREEQYKSNGNGNGAYVLIVAPKSLLPLWKAELEKWLIFDKEKVRVVVTIVTAKGGIPSSLRVPPKDATNDDDDDEDATSSNDVLVCHVLLVNYDIFSRYRSDLDDLGVSAFDVLICDEAHYLKNMESLRTRAILGDSSTAEEEHGKKKQLGKRLRPIQAHKKWFLTGSPILNNPIELYPLLRALDPNATKIPQLTSMDDFCNHYCIKHYGSNFGRGNANGAVYYKGGKNLSELRKRLRSGDPPLMVRRTKNQVLQDLPSKRHQLLPLDDDVVVQQEELTLQQALAAEGKDIIGTGSSDGTDNSALRLKDLKVRELKTRLAARGLPTSGRKADLVERLRQHASVAASARARGMAGDDNDDGTGQTEVDDTAEVFENVGSALRLETGGRRWEGLQDIILKGSGSVIMGALAKARHATALEKVSYAIEIVERVVASRQKIVVFAHHRDVQDALFEAFEDRAVILHGGSSQDERSHVVHQFQNDKTIHVFIGSIRAAGVGITLTAASHVLFVEFDWSPMIVQQAEDRCHRVGQKSNVLIQYLFFRGTIDEHIASLLLSKQSTVAAAVDIPTGPASWVFDFGKHKGTTVADVAASDPRYLRWIIEQEAHVRRKRLAEALSALGYISGKEDVRGTSPSISVQNPDRTRVTEHCNFIMPFGKHKGKHLGEVPTDYRQWLISSGASRNNAHLTAALRGLEEVD